MTIRNWKVIAGVIIAVIAIVSAVVVPTVMANGNEKLAESLGITEEELDAAQQGARDAAIEQAVSEGLITQEQADRMQNCDGFGRMRDGFMMRGFGEGTIDYQALLANELGITEDELQAALEEAYSLRLAEAVENGCITQEQADSMQAHHDLMNYFNQDEVRETIRSAYEDVINQAVANGVITQEQADNILNNQMFGFGGMRGFGMRGDFGMHGGFKGHGGCFGMNGGLGPLPNGDDMPSPTDAS